MIWNVVDRRKRPHRWLRINAIIEATWQDNSCFDADQAPIDESTNNVTYDQRESISLHDAVVWAGAQACAVTLYLYDEGEGVR